MSKKLAAALYVGIFYLVFSVSALYSAEPDSIKRKESPLWTEEKPDNNLPGEEEMMLILSDGNISMDSNGYKWKTFYLDGLYIFLNLRYLKNYGRYYALDLYIQNSSDRPQFFDFKNASIVSEKGRRPFFSYDKYLRRVRCRKGWSSFGWGVLTLGIAFILDEIINGDYYDGRAGYYSPGLDFLHETSSFLIHETAFFTMAVMVDSFERDYLGCVQKNMGYLSSYNIPKSSAIRGHALAKYWAEADKVKINIPVGGKVYVFEWEASDLEYADELD